MNAAYREQSESLNVSRTALYNKLNRTEPPIAQALIRYSTEQFQPIITALGGQVEQLLPGYRVQILDGNCLGASEHRLAVLRDLPSAPLPGKSLVVLDPVARLATDLFPCEDGYTSERALLDRVLALDMCLGPLDCRPPHVHLGFPVGHCPTASLLHYSPAPDHALGSS